MNQQPSKEYKDIKATGQTATALLFLQILLLPLIILYPFFLDKKTITVRVFVLTAAINVALETLLIVMLVIKAEPLKHPENLSVRQIRRNAFWMSVTILIVAAISLIGGGRFGVLWLVFLFFLIKAIRIAKEAEKAGIDHISQ